jgi:CubicO group peptidase (beta-lactamase class C family)
MLRLVTPLVAIALPATALAQDLTATELAAIDRSVTAALAETGVPSVQVAVVRGGQVVLERAWGKTSETIPGPRTDLPYPIASNSKQFLGALLLMLENDGKLGLDDKVAKWLPEVSGAKDITIRQLLSHTAGLQDYWPQDFAFAAMEKPVAPAGIVARWGMKPLDYAPGTRWQYSNTGYVVAGMIAEKVGGAPLWQQFEQRLFKPLGIKAVPIDAAVGPAFPQGYTRYALGPVRPVVQPAQGWLWAAGEAAVTAGDLAKWNIARLNRTLLPREDWEEMERPVRLADGTSTGYGLGVSMRETNGRRVIEHGGAAIGFLSQNAIWQDDGIAVTVLTNAEFARVQDRLTNKIAEIVLPPSPQANTGESPRTHEAKAILEKLIVGRVDLSFFTENGRYYFKPQVLADFSDSLTPLGPLTAFEPIRTPRLRGGFVNRNYRLTFGTKKLILVTYAEPGPDGRWEQFMVMPE